MKHFCIIFDIDETLLQVLPNDNSKYWDKLSETTKKKIKHTTSVIETNSYIIFLRPYIKRLFEYFKNNQNIFKVAIWTYGNREYATDIKETLISELQLPDNFFLFVWGKEDIPNDNTPKDLKQVYTKFPEYNPSNTFLVDNLSSNLSHLSNIENSILIPSFMPFTSQPKDIMKSFTQDKWFIVLLRLCKKIENFQSKIEITYPIFSLENIKNMHLDKIIKPNITSDIRHLTITNATILKKTVSIRNTYRHTHNQKEIRKTKNMNVTQRKGTMKRTTK